MKKTLRLLVTNVCNRSCEGCCNKDYNINNLPRISIDKLTDYDEIIITGGEPMIFVSDLNRLLNKIMEQKISKGKIDCKVYLYTADYSMSLFMNQTAKLIDGITFTIHDTAGYVSFNYWNDALHSLGISKHYSKRLNVFKGFPIPEFATVDWKIKSDIEWIKNCPVPENEDFMALETLFEEKEANHGN